MAPWKNNPLRVLALLSAFTVASCGDDDDGMTRAACPDLTGVWRSGDYEALRVLADGTHQEITGLSMSLTIDEQDDCVVRGSHTWSNGEIGGSEILTGALSREDGWLNLLEVADHPEGGSNGRILGRFVADDRITWEYAGYADNGSKAIVFGTILDRTEPPEREQCADLTGFWSASGIEVLEVDADGTVRLQHDGREIFEIVHQSACEFRAVNDWQRGPDAGSDQLAGALHSDGGFITLLEVGDTPAEDSTAFIFGRLPEIDRFEWSYLAVANDSSQGQVFSAVFGRDETTGGNADDCPDLRGRWTDSTKNGLLTFDDGTHRLLASVDLELVIDQQFGCKYSGVAKISDDDETGALLDGIVIGAMNGAERILTLRPLGSGGNHAAEALITGRVLEPDRIELDIVTPIESDDGVISLAAELDRE